MDVFHNAWDLRCFLAKSHFFPLWPRDSCVQSLIWTTPPATAKTVWHTRQWQKIWEQVWKKKATYLDILILVPNATRLKVSLTSRSGRTKNIRIYKKKEKWMRSRIRNYKALGTSFYCSSGSGAVLVPRTSVSFGHVVGETEDSANSNYQMSVYHWDPAALN